MQMFKKRSWNDSTPKTNEKTLDNRSGVKSTSSSEEVPANKNTWSDKMKGKMEGLKDKIPSVPKMPTMRIPTFSSKPDVESGKHNLSNKGFLKKDGADNQDKASTKHKQGSDEPTSAPQSKLTSLASSFSFGKTTERATASSSRPDKFEGGGLLGYLRGGKKAVDQNDKPDEANQRLRALSDTDSEVSSQATTRLGPKSKPARARTGDKAGEPEDADEAPPRNKHKGRASSEQPVKAKRQELDEDSTRKRKPTKDKGKSQREKDGEDDVQEKSGGEGTIEGEPPRGSGRRRRVPADGECGGPSEKSDSMTRSSTKRASLEEDTASHANFGSNITPPLQAGDSGHIEGGEKEEVKPRDKGKGKRKTKKKDASFKDEDNTSEASRHSKGSASSHATAASIQQDVSKPKGPPKPRIKELAFFTVHSSGPLEPNVHMTAPVVRIHMLDAASGEPLWCHERGAGQRVGGEGEAGPRRVSSLQTLPFPLKERKGLELVAKWDQRVCVEEVEAERVVHADTLVLIEVLQLPSSFSSYSADNTAFRNGVLHVAWGFLRLVNKQGKKNLGRSKVQLYRYCPESTKLDLSLLGLKSKPKPGSTLLAYQSWQRLQNVAPDRRPTYCTWLELSVEVAPHPLTELNDRDAWEPTPSRPTLTQRVENERAFGGLADENNVRSGRDQIRQKLGRVPVEQLLGQMTLSQQMHEEPEEEEQGARQMLQVPVREPGDECQVPNALHSTVAAGPRGCNLVAFSPDGSMLASVCAGTLKFGVRIHLTASGACVHSFSGHHEMVYDLGWSADNAFVSTASSDFTAKVWAVHAEQGGANPSASRPHQVLQHPCFVYAATFHPTFTNPLIVATGAYDNTVRLWSCETGEQVFSLCVHQACVNTLAFDVQGKRLYTGDGEGVVKELSCDTRGRVAKSQLEISEELEPEVKKLRRLNLKLLRSCSELLGEPIAHVRVHPQGRRLIVLSKRSRLCEIDIKLLIVSHNFPGARCMVHPLKMEVSPDGRYIICGSEDGRVMLWEFQSRKEHVMTSYQVGKDMVYSISWNKTHHTLALAYHDCSTPIAVHRFDSKQPPALPKIKDVAFSVAPKLADRKQLYPALPDHLTPSVVAEMMASIRLSKEQLMERVGSRLSQSKQRAQISKKPAELTEVASSSSQSDDEEEDQKPGGTHKAEPVRAPAASHPPSKQSTAAPIPNMSAPSQKHIAADTARPEVPSLVEEEPKALTESKPVDKEDAKLQETPEVGLNSDAVASKQRVSKKADNPNLASSAIPNPIELRPERYGLAADLQSEASKLPRPEELPSRATAPFAPLPALAPFKAKAKLPDFSVLNQPEAPEEFGLMAALAPDSASAAPAERPESSIETPESNAPATIVPQPAAEEFGLAADVVKDELDSTQNVEEVIKKTVLQPLQQSNFGLEADLYELADTPSPVPFPGTSKHTTHEDAKNRSRSSSPDADQWIPAMKQTSTSNAIATSALEDAVKEGVASILVGAHAPRQPPRDVPEVQGLEGVAPSQVHAPPAALTELPPLSRPAPLPKLEKWSSGGGFGLLEELEEVPDAYSCAPAAELVALSATTAYAQAPAPSPPPPSIPAEEPGPKCASALVQRAPSMVPAIAASPTHISAASCLTEPASSAPALAAPNSTVPAKMGEPHIQATTEAHASDIPPSLDHGNAHALAVPELPISPSLRESEGQTLTYPIDHGLEVESDRAGFGTAFPQNGKSSQSFQAPSAHRAGSGWGTELPQTALTAPHGSSGLPYISTQQPAPTVLDESIESISSKPVVSDIIASTSSTTPDLGVLSNTENARGGTGDGPSTSIPDHLFISRMAVLPTPPSMPISSEGTSGQPTQKLAGFGLEEVFQDSAPSATVVAAPEPRPETTQATPVAASEDTTEVSYSDTFDEVELGTMTVPRENSSTTPRFSEMANAAKEVQEMMSQPVSSKVASELTNDPAPQAFAEDSVKDTIWKAVDSDSIDSLAIGIHSGQGDSRSHAVSSHCLPAKPPIDVPPPAMEPTTKAVVMHEDMEIEDLMDEFM